LCSDTIDTEHPDSIYDINPKTMRRAWMHTFCFVVAEEELQDTPSSNINYKNKYDEYLSKRQGQN